MEAPLKFDYDAVGDTLYITRVQPYAAQDVDPLEYNLLARRNPTTGALEGLEIQFFTRWILKNPTGGTPANLAEWFAQSAA